MIVISIVMPVYNKEKWTTKNSWHFTSKKIKPTSNTTKFLYP